MELPVSGVAMHGAALAKVGGIHQARHGKCHCSCVASLRCKRKSTRAPISAVCLCPWPHLRVQPVEELKGTLLGSQR